MKETMKNEQVLIRQAFNQTLVNDELTGSLFSQKKKKVKTKTENKKHREDKKKKKKKQ